MKPMHYVGVVFGVILMAFLALTTEVLPVPEAKPCTQAWFQYLDDHYHHLGYVFDPDDDGGEPDLGDREWLYGFTVMTKIKVPEQLSDQRRCQFVQKTLQRRVYIVNKAFGWMFIFKVR
jgi:endo-1,4-beta-D-glucanase Y